MLFSKTKHWSCSMLAIQHKQKGCLHREAFLCPCCLIPYSSDGLTASLPGKDDIFLDSMMLNRSVNSQEFSLSAASPFSLSDREAGYLCLFMVLCLKWSPIRKLEKQPDLKVHRTICTPLTADQKKQMSLKKIFPLYISALLGVRGVPWFGHVSKAVDNVYRELQGKKHPHLTSQQPGTWSTICPQLKANASFSILFQGYDTF